MTWSGASSGEHFLASNPPPISTPGVGGPAYDKDGAVTHVRNYGAIPDGVVFDDAAITNGQAILTSPSNKLAGAVIGMAVGVVGAGAAGVTLVTTVLSAQGNGQVTLNANAGATVSGAHAAFGTDNTTAINNALADLANWNTLQWGRGRYCATNSLLPPSTCSRKRLWGVGISQQDSSAGTLILQLTDNVPIWKWSSNIATHGNDWRGMSSEYLAYQPVANTQAYGCMFATPPGANGSFFHFTSEGGLTFAKCYVGIGLNQADIDAGRSPTFWGSEMRDVQLLHISGNFLKFNAVAGLPNVRFVDLYCSNTNGPVVATGDAIQCSATELEIDGLDLEGWQGRLLLALGGTNVTLRQVHIENGVAVAVAAFSVANASVFTLENLSYSAAYNGAFGNVWIVQATGGCRARLTALRLVPGNAGGNNIYVVTNDATSPVTIDGISANANVKVPTNGGNAGAITMVQEAHIVQTPAFSATPAPDPGLGEIFHPGAMTGAVAVANPARGWPGARLYMIWDEDGVGGRALTYPGANWRAVGIAAQVTTLSTRTIDEAYCIDGTVWMVTRLVTGQTV